MSRKDGFFYILCSCKVDVDLLAWLIFDQVNDQSDLFLVSLREQECLLLMWGILCFSGFSFECGICFSWRTSILLSKVFFFRRFLLKFRGLEFLFFDHLYELFCQCFYPFGVSVLGHFGSPFTVWIIRPGLFLLALVNHWMIGLCKHSWLW